MQTNPLSRNSYAPQLLIGGTVLAVILAIAPEPASDWALDALTGLTALAGAWLAGMRLAFDPSSSTVRRAWQIALALFVLVGIREFGGPWAERIETGFRIAGLADGLVLIAAFVALYLTSGHDDVPRRARYLLWAGFLLHLATVTLDVLGPGPAISRPSPAVIGSIIDLSQFLCLQLYVIGALSFVAHLRRQALSSDRSPAVVGDLARSIFSTHVAGHRLRYPRVWLLSLPGGKILLSLGRFVYWFAVMSRAVSDGGHRSIWRQFIDLFALAFRHDLDAQAYYMFELYRTGNRRRAGGYITRYETKNGLFKLLRRELSERGPRTPLDDKLQFADFCERHAFPHPPLLGIAKDGVLQFRNEAGTSLDQDFFIKPAKSKGSRGSESFRNVGAGLYVDGSGRELDLPALSKRVSDRSIAGTLLVQSRLANHPGIADLASESLIAVRVISCLDQANRAMVTHGMLRVITKLEPDWPISAELGVSIDLETGRLGQMTGDKGEALLHWWDNHPVTGAPVTGRLLPEWAGIKSLVLAAHNACEGRLIVGWDIALTPQGPMLLEGNAYPDADFPQRVHRCSIGDSPLGPPLYARLVELQRRIAAGTISLGAALD